MESTVGVALAAKLLKLFPESDEKFLSFPMTGLAFTQDELDFLSDDEGLSASEIRDKWKHKSQFARLLNLIPADSVIYSGTDRMLWTEYDSILEQAKLAKSLLTPEESEALRRAEDFLTDVHVEDGVDVRVYSQAVKKYYEYKTAYEEIECTYLDEELTARGSRRRHKSDWETKRKKELLALKKKALSDWMLLGQKDKVEENQEIQMRLSGKLPRHYVLQYINDLKACREEDLLTNDPIGTFSTFYSPSDCFEPGVDWARIRLTRSEIEGLLTDAPAELKRYGADQGAGDMESLTIEYAKVVVIRPWFKQKFFDSRYWKLPQGDEMVSDGAIPRAGRIPAFVTNMIVARKIYIERTQPTAPIGTQPSPEPDTLDDVHLIGPALQQVNQNWTVATGGQVRTFRQKATSSRPTIFRPPVADEAVAPMDHPAAALRAKGHGKKIKDGRAVKVPRQPGKPPAILRAKVRGTTIKRGRAVKLPRHPVEPPAPPPPDRERVTEEVTLDGISVLAFVCRRLPKCPDPDDSLVWLS